MILHIIANELQQLYRLTAVPAVSEFLVDAQAFHIWCAEHAHTDPATRETLLIEQDNHTVHLGLYVAPAVLAVLSRDNPATHLHADNLDAACVAIEGVSHLLYVWQRLQAEIPCSLLELELQAEIDKYLLCVQWLRAQGGSRDRLLTRLFHSYTLHGGTANPAAARYRAASALAHRFCAGLASGPLRHHNTGQLLAAARHFYRLTHWQKLRHVGACR